MSSSVTSDKDTSTVCNFPIEPLVPFYNYDLMEKACLGVSLIKSENQSELTQKTEQKQLEE